MEQEGEVFREITGVETTGRTLAAERHSFTVQWDWRLEGDTRVPNGLICGTNYGCLVGVCEKHECLNSTKYLVEEKSFLHAVTVFNSWLVFHISDLKHIFAHWALFYGILSLLYLLQLELFHPVTYRLVYLHSGPCPPCPKMVTITCFCKKAKPIPRRCSAKEWSCQQSCGRTLLCGQHKCENHCHKGIVWPHVHYTF